MYDAKKRSRCGVAAVISTMLLLVIVVAAFSLVYGAYFSWVSAQQSGPLLQMQERISVEDVRFSSNTTATLCVFNVGTADVTISSIEINGGSSTITSSSNSAVPGISIWVNVDYPAGFTSGSTYTFKVITARGTNTETSATYTGV